MNSIAEFAMKMFLSILNVILKVLYFFIIINTPSNIRDTKNACILKNLFWTNHLKSIPVFHSLCSFNVFFLFFEHVLKSTYDKTENAMQSSVRNYDLFSKMQ